MSPFQYIFILSNRYAIFSFSQLQHHPICLYNWCLASQPSASTNQKNPYLHGFSLGRRGPSQGDLNALDEELSSAHLTGAKVPRRWTGGHSGVQLRVYLRLESGRKVQVSAEPLRSLQTLGLRAVKIKFRVDRVLWWNSDIQSTLPFPVLPPSERSSEDMRMICGQSVLAVPGSRFLSSVILVGKCAQRPRELSAQQKILRAFLFTCSQLPEDSLARQKPGWTCDPFLMGTSISSKVLCWIRG